MVMTLACVDLTEAYTAQNEHKKKCFLTTSLSPSLACFTFCMKLEERVRMRDVARIHFFVRVCKLHIC